MPADTLRSSKSGTSTNCHEAQPLRPPPHVFPDRPHPSVVQFFATGTVPPTERDRQREERLSASEALAEEHLRIFGVALRATYLARRPSVFKRLAKAYSAAATISIACPFGGAAGCSRTIEIDNCFGRWCGALDR